MNYRMKGAVALQVIMLGPLMLKYSLLTIIIAVAVGYLATLIRTRSLDAVIRKAVLDDLMTVLLIGILVWKFSPLIFDFKSVIRSPLSLLYFSGGMSGTILAVWIGVLILAYKIVRHHKPWALYANTALTWLISGYGCWSLLQAFLEDGGWESIGTAAAAGAVVAYQFRHRGQMYSAYHANVTVMWTAIALFAVSLLAGPVDEVWLGFGGMQLFLLIVLMLSLMNKVYLEKRKPL